MSSILGTVRLMAQQREPLWEARCGGHTILPPSGRKEGEVRNRAHPVRLPELSQDSSGTMEKALDLPQHVGEGLKLGHLLFKHDSD